MYKIMIVEDEELIRKGIVKSVNWHELGFEVVAEAANGKEALKKMDLDRPDVVVTDIRMPVMDGLDLAKIIKNRYPEIQIIILSGFADFEYAKTAIHFSVFEYLLKPTNKNKFIETFKKLKLELDKKQQEKKTAHVIDIKLNEGLVKLREEFIKELLNGEVTSIYTVEERMSYLELNLTGDNCVVAAIYIDGDDQNILKKWENDKKLLSYVYSNISIELLKEVGDSIVIVKNIKEIIIVVSFKNQDKQIKLLKKALSNIIKNFEELIFSNTNIKILASMGMVYPNIMHLHKSYLQSKKALEKRFFNSNKKLFVFEEGSESELEKQWIKDYPKEVNHIISETILGHVAKSRELINCIFDRFLKREVSSSLIKNYCYVLCFLLAASLADFRPAVNTIKIDKKDFENDIKKTVSMESLKQYILDLFLKTAQQISAYKESEEYSHQKKIINKVKKYISQNYSKKLTLQEISDHVYLSPTYLSFLFKNVTGEKYIDYLKKIRIKKAKELLKGRLDLKIYEAANMVGYNDYKYFTLQFKKMVGISPTEYRDRNN
ncbi:response regulator [Halocella sp. SP3-1]|uniref:response regulator n=1 Tax=Halocella sp. SP3-1 TaxID=2382161 RepID=UPI000F7641F2|nr:response regulator [Halocella sp. SP3-1]AZO94695.1 response regulator [Halocella sp. SP3-1]